MVADAGILPYGAGPTTQLTDSGLVTYLGAAGAAAGAVVRQNSRRPKIVFYVLKLFFRVPMNRLDPESLLKVLPTLSTAISEKTKCLRYAEVALWQEERRRCDTAIVSHFAKR